VRKAVDCKLFSVERVEVAPDPTHAATLKEPEWQNRFNKDPPELIADVDERADGGCSFERDGIVGWHAASALAKQISGKYFRRASRSSAVLFSRRPSGFRERVRYRNTRLLSR